jgi:hypothetical protein
MGFGPFGIVQRVPVWGAGWLATDSLRIQHIRVPRANPADVKSSTMKGPQGLTGEQTGSRCRKIRRLQQQSADGEKPSVDG